MTALALRLAFGAALLASLGLASPASAQPAPGKTYKLAIISPSLLVGDLNENGSNLSGREFFKQLKTLGYIEGQNLTIERRSAEGVASRLPALAREVSDLKPDLVYAMTSPVAAAFKAVNTTIPVIVTSADPVGTGLAASVERPGGNITGVLSSAPGVDVHVRRLELLRELRPGVARVAYFTSQSWWDTPVTANVKAAAERLGMTLVPAVVQNANDEAQLRAAFAEMDRQQVDAMYESETGDFNNQLDRIIALETAAKRPYIQSYGARTDRGGLMGYGADSYEFNRQLAVQADRIFNGAKAAELGFVVPAKFEFAINVRAASEMGLTFPPSLTAKATYTVR